MVKKGPIIATLIFSTLALTGCSSGGSTGTSGNTQSQTIKFWYTANDSDPNDPTYKWVKDSIDQFQSANPNIKIEATDVSDGGQYLTKLTTAMAANSTPDIFQTWMSGRLEPFVKAGRILPLTDAINSDPSLKGVFNPSNLDTATFNGKVYALPNTLTAEVIFYNKDIFNKYHLQPPKTWDDLLEIIKTLKYNGIIPFSLGNKDPWPGSMAYMAIFDRLFGSQKYEDVVLKHQAKWDDPAFAEAGKKLQVLKDAGAYEDNFNGVSYNEGQDLFNTGKAGMFFDGTWDVALLNSKLGDKLGYFNFPNIPDGKGKMQDDWLINKDLGFAISQGSQHQEAALKFLKFLFSKDRQKAWAEAGSLITTVNIPYDKSKIPQITSNLNNTFANVKNPMIPWDNPLGADIGKEFNLTTQSVLGGTDPVAAFKNLQSVSQKAWSNN